MRHVEPFAGDAQRLIDRWQVGIGKLYVHNRPDDLHYLADIACACGAVRSSHKVCLSPFLPLLIDYVATAQGALWDVGFGFEMIIACLKPQSCNSSPHSIAG